MSKPWPYTTVAHLETAGYKFDRLSRCTGKYKGGTCNALIHWYTTPDGKKMPIDPQTIQPHWSSCPDSQIFNRRKRDAAKG